MSDLLTQARAAAARIKEMREAEAERDKLRIELENLTDGERNVAKLQERIALQQEALDERRKELEAEGEKATAAEERVEELEAEAESREEQDQAFATDARRAVLDYESRPGFDWLNTPAWYDALKAVAFPEVG